MDNKARCPNCKGLHEISWRTHFGFVACPKSGKTYVAGVNGLTMPGPVSEGDEFSAALGTVMHQTSRSRAFLAKTEKNGIDRLRADYGIFG